MLAKDPIPSLQLQEKPVLFSEAEGLVTELRSLRFVTMQWLCSQLCFVTAADQSTVFEIELLATVGWKCCCQRFSCRCSLNVMHCRKEICVTCLSKESIPTNPVGISKHPLPARSLRFPRATVRSTISASNYGCIMPFPLLQLQKKPVLCTEVIVSKIWITGYRLCCQLWHVTAANQWTIVQIEFFTTVGCKWGCQPFSYRCWQNVTHCRKEICSACLSKKPCPSWNRSLHSLLVPDAWGPWQRQHKPPALQYACIILIPSLQLQKKASVSCREAKRLVTQLWSPRFDTILWLCSQLCCENAANQWTVVEIEFLATVGWKRGCQPFSCPRSQNVTHCRKENYATCLFQESIPAIPLGNAKHPLPARSLRLLRAAAHFASSALCLHHACKRPHPFVEDSGFVSHVERHWFGRGVVVSQVCVGILECFFFPICHAIAMSRDWTFSNSGLEGGLLAFQLPCWQNVTHCRKERLVGYVCRLRNLFPPFRLEFPSIHSLPEAGSWERQSVPPDLQYYVCIMPIPSLQLKKKAPGLVSCREAKRLVTQLWSPRLVTSYNTVIVLWVVLWDCCKPVNHCRDWIFV